MCVYIQESNSLMRGCGGMEEALRGTIDNVRARPDNDGRSTSKRALMHFEDHSASGREKFYSYFLQRSRLERAEPELGRFNFTRICAHSLINKISVVFFIDTGYSLFSS